MSLGSEMTSRYHAGKLRGKIINDCVIQSAPLSRHASVASDHIVFPSVGTHPSLFELEKTVSLPLVEVVPILTFLEASSK